LADTTSSDANIPQSPSSVGDRDWTVTVNSLSLAPYAMITASGARRLPTGFVNESCTKKVAPGAAIPTTAVAAAAASSSWVKVLSGDGEEYFWNVVSGETKWGG